MILNITFGFSGLVLVTLILAKMWEGKREKKPFILRWVSLGDERVRTSSHELAHRYTEVKEKTSFFIEKQLPLHTKNFINKTNTLIKEETQKRIGDIRGSKFLKKNEGLSEFFKSIGEKENEGRIDDTIESSQDSQDN